MKALLGELGKSQKWLAEEASTKGDHVSEAVISALIRRNQKSTVFAHQIADVFADHGYSREYVLRGRGLKRTTTGSKPTSGREPTSQNPVIRTDDSLESALETDSVEITRDAIKLARAWLDLPRRDRERYLREITALAVKHGHQSSTAKLVEMPRNEANGKK